MIHQKNNNMNANQEISLFDTNIFLTGIDFNLFKGIIYTTPKIINEINVDKYKERNRNIFTKIQAAIVSKKLIVKHPFEEFILRVEEYSKITGDYKALSIADKELIALSLELKETKNGNVKLYTNDYTMENLCSELNIPFSPIHKKGIKSKIIWEVYCPFCDNIHKSEDLYKTCGMCGFKLKRRKKR